MLARAARCRRRALRPGVQVGDSTLEPVENEDLVTFTATFAGGATGTFSDLARRVRPRQRARLRDLLRRSGAAGFDLESPAEFTIRRRRRATSSAARLPPGAHRAGPPVRRARPADGLPRALDHGQNDFFVFQARAFLDQIAGLDRAAALPDAGGRPAQPPRPGCCHGLGDLRRLGVSVFDVSCFTRRTRDETRRLHRLPARPAAARRAPSSSAELGLTGAEINAGGFIPAPHLPIEEVRPRRRGARQLPRRVRGGGHRADRAERQRQPAAPRSRGRTETRRRPPRGHRGSGAARGPAGRGHVGTSRRP